MMDSGSDSAISVDGVTSQMLRSQAHVLPSIKFNNYLTKSIYQLTFLYTASQASVSEERPCLLRSTMTIAFAMFVAIPHASVCLVLADPTKLDHWLLCNFTERYNSQVDHYFLMSTQIVFHPGVDKPHLKFDHCQDTKL